MNKLKELLTSLHGGRVVELVNRRNQHGEQITVDSISFEDGVWKREQLNCWSSLDWGFGTCRCTSHPAFTSRRISRKEVLSHLRQILREETEDRAARDAEIAWLEEQSKAL